MRSLLKKLFCKVFTIYIYCIFFLTVQCRMYTLFQSILYTRCFLAKLTPKVSSKNCFSQCNVQPQTVILVVVSFVSNFLGDFDNLLQIQARIMIRTQHTCIELFHHFLTTIATLSIDSNEAIIKFVNCHVCVLPTLLSFFLFMDFFTFFTSNF